jgi:hydroxyethylthiazole kinase
VKAPDGETGFFAAWAGTATAAVATSATPLDAAVAASRLMATAAEQAAAQSRGPGSFAVALLDALAAPS